MKHGLKHNPPRSLRYFTGSVSIKPFAFSKDLQTKANPSRVEWQPLPGPQTAALESQADIIGYGGAAGGGKTDLALGMAALKHYRSVIFRRVFPSVRGIIERSREIFARGETHAKDSYNESLHLWRLADGRVIEFGAVQYEADKRKHQGQARDFIVFDEATEFPENIVRFIMAWNRTTRSDVQPQTLLTFNPPHDEDGQWVVKFFAPWLDPDYQGIRATDGELRWFTTVNGVDTEVPEGTPGAKSRTFIAASLSDNPHLLNTGYGATIDSLPEPLRSLLKGDFAAGRKADPWKVIPSEWVKRAMARPATGGQQRALGVDVARGGDDQTVIASLDGDSFTLYTYPGTSTPDGPSVAALALQHLRGGVIGVDVVGVGASVYDQLAPLASTIGINAGAGTDESDKTHALRFVNVRAAMWWSFREALEDENLPIALPDDNDLRVELCAPRFSIRNGRILVESKDDIRKRIGRSTDQADAVIMAWWAAHKNVPLLLFGE
jgi:hypothetical protein